MSKTTWKEHYASSPRLKEIEAIFKLIDSPTALEIDILAAMNRCMVQMNAEDRENLPRWVRPALKDREPYRVTERHLPY